MNRKNIPSFIQLPHIVPPVNDLISAYNLLSIRANDEQFYTYADIKNNVAASFPIKENGYKYVSITDIDEALKDTWAKKTPSQMYKMAARGLAPALDDRNYTQIKKDVPESVIDFLKQFKGQVSRTRFAVLGAHKTIKDHIDNDLYHTIRVHVPLITDIYNIFAIKDSLGKYSYLNMEVGKAYFINAAMSHFVVNGSAQDRLHLIINLNTHEDLDGLVSE